MVGEGAGDHGGGSNLAMVAGLNIDVVWIRVGEGVKEERGVGV